MQTTELVLSEGGREESKKTQRLRTIFEGGKGVARGVIRATLSTMNSGLEVFRRKLREVTHEETHGIKFSISEKGSRTTNCILSA